MTDQTLENKNNREYERAAVRKKATHVLVVGAFMAGISPWFYFFAIGFIELVSGWNGMGQPQLAFVFLALSVISCLVILPLSMGIHYYLGRRAALQAGSVGQRASAVSAVALTALTVVHLPAVMGILYYAVSGWAEAALAIEVAAFLLYLPLQWMTWKSIIRLTL